MARNTITALRKTDLIVISKAKIFLKKFEVWEPSNTPKSPTQMPVAQFSVKIQ
jgi:hypothetical protein